MTKHIKPEWMTDPEKQESINHSISLGVYLYKEESDKFWLVKFDGEKVLDEICLNDDMLKVICDRLGYELINDGID